MGSGARLGPLLTGAAAADDDDDSEVADGHWLTGGRPERKLRRLEWLLAGKN